MALDFIAQPAIQGYYRDLDSERRQKAALALQQALQIKESYQGDRRVAALEEENRNRARMAELEADWRNKSHALAVDQYGLNKRAMNNEMATTLSRTLDPRSVIEEVPPIIRDSDLAGLYKPMTDSPGGMAGGIPIPSIPGAGRGYIVPDLRSANERLQAQQAEENRIARTWEQTYQQTRDKDLDARTLEYARILSGGRGFDSDATNRALQTALFKEQVLDQETIPSGWSPLTHRSQIAALTARNAVRRELALSVMGAKDPLAEAIAWLQANPEKAKVLQGLDSPITGGLDSILKGLDEIRRQQELRKTARPQPALPTGAQVPVPTGQPMSSHR